MEDSDDHNDPPGSTDNPAPTPEPIPEDPAPNTDETTDASQSNKEPPKPEFDRAMLHWTRVVGFFTAILAIVGVVQTWAFIQSERAFLNPTMVGFGSNGFSASQRLQIVVPVQNGGRATAFITRANLTPYVGTFLPKVPPYATFGNQSGGAVTAAGNTNLTIHEPDKPGSPYMIDHDIFDRVSRGDLRFYVFGYIEWVDDFSFFGHPKRVGYCEVYSPGNGAWNLQFSQCPNAAAYIYLK